MIPSINLDIFVVEISILFINTNDSAAIIVATDNAKIAAEPNIIGTNNKLANANIPPRITILVENIKTLKKAFLSKLLPTFTKAYESINNGTDIANKAIEPFIIAPNNVLPIIAPIAIKPTKLVKYSCKLVSL